MLCNISCDGARANINEIVQIKLPAGLSVNQRPTNFVQCLKFLEL